MEIWARSLITRTHHDLCLRALEPIQLSKAFRNAWDDTVEGCLVQHLQECRNVTSKWDSTGFDQCEYNKRWNLLENNTYFVSDWTIFATWVQFAHVNSISSIWFVGTRPAWSLKGICKIYCCGRFTDFLVTHDDFQWHMSIVHMLVVKSEVGHWLLYHHLSWPLWLAKIMFPWQMTYDKACFLRLMVLGKYDCANGWNRAQHVSFGWWFQKLQWQS